MVEVGEFRIRVEVQKKLQDEDQKDGRIRISSNQLPNKRNENER
jgi:hypothetical protein